MPVICTCGHSLQEHDEKTGLCLHPGCACANPFYRQIMDPGATSGDSGPSGKPIPVAGPVEVKEIPLPDFSWDDLKDAIEVRVKFDKAMIDITYLDKGTFPPDMVADFAMKAGIWNVIGAVAKLILHL
jgi:hypothetical protein